MSTQTKKPPFHVRRDRFLNAVFNYYADTTDVDYLEGFNAAERQELYSLESDLTLREVQRLHRIHILGCSFLK